VNQYGAAGLQLLIVVGGTDSFMEGPTPEYCQALQATQQAHVLYDPNGQVTGVLNMRVNTGSAILDGNGIWLTNPVGDNSFSEALTALFSIVR
jgi:hypothetical protein